MKILLVAESWDERTGPYETPGSYYVGILTRLGHDVRVVDNKRSYLPVGRRTVQEYRPWQHRLRLERLNNRIVNRRVRETAQRWAPDLILLTKCENVTAETVRWLKESTSAMVVNWDHDNPFWAENTSLELLRSIRTYDAFGIWAKFLFPALRSAGCRRVEYWPMFFNVERFSGPADRGREMGEGARSEIAFVGSPSPERVEMLRHLMDFDLAIWGSWECLAPDDPLRRKVRGGLLDGRGYARALRATQIAINVLNVQNRGASNTRTFEATGSGRLLLTEYSVEQAEDLFEEDREIVCFRSPEELRDKARYYLRHDRERERIAAAGRERTMREHTLEHRLARIVAVAEEIRKGA